MSGGKARTFSSRNRRAVFSQANERIMHWRWFIVTEGVKIGKLGSTQEWSFQANRFATPHASTLDHDLGGSLGDCGFDLGFCGVSFEQVMNSAHRQRAVLQGFDHYCSLGAEKIIGEDEGGAGFTVAPEREGGFQVGQPMAGD